MTTPPPTRARPKPKSEPWTRPNPKPRAARSSLSDAQKAAAVSAMGYWDDLVPLKFVNVGDVSTSEWARNEATILLANTSTGPAQAWAYYPGYNHQYQRVSSDVWVADPQDNNTNNWFDFGG